MADTGIGWTDERVELLARLWSEGLSASQIAAQLGDVTRNAVIGKVHRLGLSGRAKPNGAASQQERPRPKVVRAVPPAGFQGVASGGAAQNGSGMAGQTSVSTVAEVLELEDVAVPPSERVTIMELRDSMCRWPLGDPTTAEFGYCGTRSITGLPYCTHHARIAYQPATDRRRDRRIAIRA
jgi:GcrA cell cycle regulator